VPTLERILAYLRVGRWAAEVLVVINDSSDRMGRVVRTVGSDSVERAPP